MLSIAIRRVIGIIYQWVTLEGLSIDAGYQWLVGQAEPRPLHRPEY